MVKRLMIANGVVFLLQILTGRTSGDYPDPLTRLGALSAEGVFQHGYLWQPFTYMWLHAPEGIFHIAFNMLALWMFGGTLEQVWGSRRFLRFYLQCGVGAGVMILLVNSFTAPGTPTLGASGAIYGVLTAFSLLWPDRTILLIFPPIPIRAIWFIPTLFLLQLLWGSPDVSHVGHLGGVLVAGFLMRQELSRYVSFSTLRYRWRRYRMRHRLRALRREEWERGRRDDGQPPTYH
jgi:membrane associated rhomboid family serine protease